MEKTTFSLEISLVSVMRLKVLTIRLSLPVKLKNCFGFFFLLSGHNLSPLPPAMIMGWSQSIFLEGEIFIFVVITLIFQIKFAEFAEIKSNMIVRYF